MITLAVWAIVQATSGARRKFTLSTRRRGGRRELAAPPAAPPHRQAGRPLAGGRRPARRAAPCRPPAVQSCFRGAPARPPSRVPASPWSCSATRHAAQYAVDEAAGILARECLRQLDRLVDGGFGGDLAVDSDLVDRDSQHDPIHLRHLLELPVLGGFGQDAVELVAVGDDPADQLAGEVGYVGGGRTFDGVVLQHLFGVVRRALQLEKDLERQLPGL